MKLKTYQACSMAEALAAVKRDLGRDAVILHTRHFRKGGLLGLGGRQMWEITASQNVNVPARPLRNADAAAGGAKAIPAPKAAASLRKSASNSAVAVIDGPDLAPLLEEEPPLRARVPARPTLTRLAAPPGAKRAIPAAAKAAAPAGTLPPSAIVLAEQLGKLTGMVEKLLRRQEAPDAPPAPEELFEVYLNLLQQDVAEDIARELVQKLRSELTPQQLANRAAITERLLDSIASMIPTQVPVTGNVGRPRVIVLIGPTGVGKTTTIAKLAANLKLRQNQHVGLITVDTYRIAAVEQLRTYAQIIHVPLSVVMSPEELSSAIEDMADMDVILVDTAGRSQRNGERLDELKRFLAAARADEVHLVLSTTANQKNLQSAIERFGALGADRLILTKLDEAVSFGMILNIVRRMDAALSFVTTGQDVPDDIEVGEGRKLAQRIVGGTCGC
jgi:flagellar biosynthesis protein FlhF